jgi:tetratricopeptide (TPR) repeat protein
MQTLNIALAKFPSDKSVKENIEKLNAIKTNNILANATELYKKKKYNEAIEQYKKITPETLETVIGIAESYREMSDTDNAIIYYKKALDIKPVDSDIAYYIAVLYGEKQDFDSAKIYLNKALTFNKNNTQAAEFLSSIIESERSNLLAQAISDYEANNYDDSLKKFNELISRDPKNSYAFYYRGMIFDSQNKNQDAINDFKKAYELNKEFKICNYLIAADYDTLKNYKNAFDYYNLYANSDVNDDEYKQYAKARAEELKEYANQQK